MFILKISIFTPFKPSPSSECLKPPMILELNFYANGKCKATETTMYIVMYKR